MAGNKFATMLQRSVHKLSVILVYAVLEWILILLLLLNSLFSYIITKFANYFGLKPPCLLCSRVDHVLEPGNSTDSYRNLVCETHATEISELGYCSNHRRLAKSRNMCFDCLASRPSIGITRRITFISWVSKDAPQNGEKILKCSCCNDHPYLFFKPSWGALTCSQKGNLVIQAIDDDDGNSGSGCKKLENPDLSLARSIEGSIGSARNDGKDHNSSDEEHQVLSDAESFGLKDEAKENYSSSESALLQCDGRESNKDQQAGSSDIAERDCYAVNVVHQSSDDTILQCFAEDDSLKIITAHCQRSPGCGSNRLIPVDLIDELTSACESKEKNFEKQDHPNANCAVHIETQAMETTYPKEETMDRELYNTTKSSALHAEESGKDLVRDGRKELGSPQSTPTSLIGGNNVQEPDDLFSAAQEGETNDSELLVGQTKTRPLTANDEPRAQESSPLPLPCLQAAQSSSNSNGPSYIRNILEDKIISDDNYQQLSPISEPNEAEDDKFPETPTSFDSMHNLHKKLLLFDKREIGTDASLDGNVISEMDGADLGLTVEKLKAARMSERKALTALYAELEAERSASAIAANQTMAMINRLQEEKAAMQMEALQYQRMMEEQSEYDQEALQLLNELMIKREKEKEELEKELEVYRNKVLDYEATETRRKMRRSRNSSASCSNAGDIEELSIDLNREVKDEDGSIYGNQENGKDDEDEVINLREIALDCVKQISALDDPLAEFEEERMSIIDQLKALEEKLLALGDNEVTEDLNSSTLGNPVKEFNESYEEEENGLMKTMCSMAKSVLPLVNAAENRTEENMESEYMEMEGSSASQFEIDSNKKPAIEEEVAHVFERPQSVDADKEFLRQCTSSVKKADNDTDLLQAIFQHLRNLRT